MHYKKSLVAGLVLSLMLWTFGTTACRSSTPASNTASTNADSSNDFTTLLTNVSSGVGKVSSHGGSGTPKILVFEELHTSIAGQFEIAVMLLRLRNQHGLREIALEGLTKDKSYPSVQWFRQMGGPENGELRNQIAVGLMRAGEISAVDLMAMVFPDTVVHAADDPVAYPAKLTEKANRAIGSYLYKIALKSPDNWVKQMSEELNKETRRSIEELQTLIQQIEQRAAAVGANLSEEDRRGMAETKAFFDAARTRTKTMVDTSVEIGRSASLVAMNVGAAHTSEIVQMFQNSKATYGVLSPLALANGLKAGDLTVEAFERKGDLMSVAFNGKGLGGLLDGRRKYPPAVDQKWLQAEAQLRYATAVIVRSGGGGGKFPDSIPKDEINSLPDVKVHADSIRKEPNGDISFLASVLGQKGWVDIYVRGGMPNGIAALEKHKGQALEKLLLENLDEIRKEPGERKEPTREPVTEMVTPDVAAAYAKTPAALKQMKISG